MPRIQIGAISLIVVAVLALAGYAVAQLGSLEPPPGPIEPTGASLDQISTALDDIQASLGGRCCLPPTYRMAGAERDLSIDGAGFVHKVIVANEGDGATDGLVLVGEFVDGSRVGAFSFKDLTGGPSQIDELVLNVRFTSSVRFVVEDGSRHRVTALYRFDSDTF